MARSYRVDIVLFHCDYVFYYIITARYTSGTRIEFMAVHALEDDPSAVQQHKSVPEFKLPEPCLLRDALFQISVHVIDFNAEFIQVRMLRTPQQRLFYHK